MADDEQNELICELRAMSAELREGIRIWRESVSARHEIDRTTLESKKQLQEMAREQHLLAMESQRCYQRHLEDHHLRDTAAHEARMEDHRIWREGHQKWRQRNGFQGRTLLAFLVVAIAGWFLLVSVYLFDWLGNHPSVVVR